MSSRTLLFTVCMFLMFEWIAATTFNSSQNANWTCWNDLKETLLPEIRNKLDPAHEYLFSYSSGDSYNFQREATNCVHITIVDVYYIIKDIDKISHEQQEKVDDICSKVSSLRANLSAVTSTDLMKNYVDNISIIDLEESKRPSYKELNVFIKNCHMLYNEMMALGSSVSKVLPN